MEALRIGFPRGRTDPADRGGARCRNRLRDGEALTPISGIRPGAAQSRKLAATCTFGQIDCRGVRPRWGRSETIRDHSVTTGTAPSVLRVATRPTGAAQPAPSGVCPQRAGETSNGRGRRLGQFSLSADRSVATRDGGAPSRSNGAPVRLIQATGKPKARAPAASQPLEDTNRIRSVGTPRALTASS